MNSPAANLRFVMPLVALGCALPGAAPACADDDIADVHLVEAARVVFDAATGKGAVFKSGTAEVDHKPVIQFAAVTSEAQPALPGHVLRTYTYQAVLIDGEVEVTKYRTLRLVRGTLYLHVSVADQPLPQLVGAPDPAGASSWLIPWWYPIVPAGSSDTGVVSTDIIVQASPRFLGPTINRTFFVSTTGAPDTLHVWTNRPGTNVQDPTDPDAGRPQGRLTKAGWYVLAEGPRHGVTLEARELIRTDDTGEMGRANEIYDEALRWAQTCGLRP